MEGKPHTATLADEPASPPMPQQGVGGLSAGAARQDPSRIWLPELVQRFADCLAPNEVACALRLVNKATAAQFRRPQDRTIRLSLPVPPSEFARRWSSEDAMRNLNRSQHGKLPRLVACSGCTANLEVLLSRDDSVAHALGEEMLLVAACAGELEVCRWLRQRGVQLIARALEAAAGSGRREECEWLISQGCPCVHLAAGFAARGGHVGMMDWLLEAGPSPGVPDLLAGAAVGCDLPTLQRLHTAFVVDNGAAWSLDAAVACAAASPTADWRAKVEWLEGLGDTRTDEACAHVAYLADGRTRLEWLLQRGYRLSSWVLRAAASNSDVGVLQLVLAGGLAAVNEQEARSVVNSAARAGNLAALQVLLHAPGFGVPAFSDATSWAAAGGHMPVVEWLVETLGAANVLTVLTYQSSARSGSTELLAWLHAHGCPWDTSVFAAAAQWGSEEQLEWLVARGCPMGEDGEPYAKALQYGGLAMLRCLRRLGCPWGPHGHTFTRAAECCASSAIPPAAALPTLLWLLEQGCPVDWDAALGEAQQRPELLEWLREQQGQREPRA